MSEGTAKDVIDRSFLYALILFLLIGILLIPCYLHKVNPDGISYFSIAEKYLDRDFKNALNGYWGPLYSWLLVIFMGIGFSAVLSAKLLSMIIGVVFLWQADKFYILLGIRRKWKTLLLFLTMINLIYFALSVVTPDFLFACLILIYINLMIGNKYRKNKRYGILAGFVGALLYLTKAYGLPFFLFHYLVINLLFYFLKKEKSVRKTVVFNFLSGMIIFLLISVPWIILISGKYGYFTIGTSGRFNHALIGPETKDFPVHINGLLPPPNSTANSVWEDISYEEMPDWSATSSWRNILHQLWTIFKNIVWTGIILSQYSFLAIFILLGILIYLYRQGWQSLHSRIFFVLISMLILFSGYLLILVVVRYLWVCMVFLLGAGGGLLTLISEKYKQKRALQTFIVVVFSLSFVIYPVIKTVPNLRGKPHIERINSYLQEMKIKGKIASNERWHDGVWLAYFNDWHYYGERGETSESEFKEQLKEYEIDYYIHWESEEIEPPYIKGYEEITSGKYPEFKIYNLKAEKKLVNSDKDHPQNK